MSKLNTKALPTAWLPNQDGFTFMANMKNGTIEQKKVFKNEEGLHMVEDYQNIQSWFKINVKK